MSTLKITLLIFLHYFSPVRLFRWAIWSPVEKKWGNFKIRTWGMFSCRATPRDSGSSRRMSGWPVSQYLTEGFCSVEHHKRGAHFWSSETTDIKSEGFCFHLSLASVWHFPGSIVCLSSGHSQFCEKKKHVCKPGFEIYGKPTAGGSHSLGSC